MYETFPGYEPDELDALSDEELKQVVGDAIGLDLAILCIATGKTPKGHMQEYRQYLETFEMPESERALHLKVVDRLITLLK